MDISAGPREHTGGAKLSAVLNVPGNTITLATHIRRINGTFVCNYVKYPSVPHKNTP